ncbi:hypothetical protein BDN70DRAFT_882950 [Pholiota conissans]|uniref:Uncharacterized protein n=1 Tax=Pholiota conissans TaxID=109636 RepID=A0A9P5YWL2_9AGAR|nr:hypothetical protein BDN70DRAFT_882950 [Pholiota conissans]
MPRSSSSTSTPSITTITDPPSGHASPISPELLNTLLRTPPPTHIPTLVTAMPPELPELPGDEPFRFHIRDGPKPLHLPYTHEKRHISRQFRRYLESLTPSDEPELVQAVPTPTKPSPVIEPVQSPIISPSVSERLLRTPPMPPRTESGNFALPPPHELSMNINSKPTSPVPVIDPIHSPDIIPSIPESPVIFAPNPLPSTQFDSFLEILQENSQVQRATADQSNKLNAYMAGLNEWLGRDARDRDMEIRQVMISRLDNMLRDLQLKGIDDELRRQEPSPPSATPSVQMLPAEAPVRVRSIVSPASSRRSSRPPTVVCIESSPNPSWSTISELATSKKDTQLTPTVVQPTQQPINIIVQAVQPLPPSGQTQLPIIVGAPDPINYGTEGHPPIIQVGSENPNRPEDWSHCNHCCNSHSAQKITIDQTSPCRGRSPSPRRDWPEPITTILPSQPIGAQPQVAPVIVQVPPRSPSPSPSRHRHHYRRSSSPTPIVNQQPAPYTYPQQVDQPPQTIVIQPERYRSPSPVIARERPRSRSRSPRRSRTPRCEHLRRSISPVRIYPALPEIRIAEPQFRLTDNEAQLIELRCMFQRLQNDTGKDRAWVAPQGKTQEDLMFFFMVSFSFVFLGFILYKGL